MSGSIPSKLFNMLPLPIIIAEHVEDTLNHPIVFLNDSFKDIFGWDLGEIKNKQDWWDKAYPDQQYQKVVERAWELEVASAIDRKEGFVLMTVNIMTKFNGQKRFKVYTELDSMLMEGYYVVAFESVPTEKSLD